MNKYASKSKAYDPKVWKSCGRKRGYETEIEALTGIGELTKVYLCSHCSKFHRSDSFQTLVNTVRTSWLYGPGGDNFVDKIRNTVGQGQLYMVDDQFGCPTYTMDLAKAIADLVQTERWGVYHAAGSGVTSWYEFAQKITSEPIIPVKSKDYIRKATRPAYSALDCSTLAETIGRTLPDWEESLQRYLK